MNGLNKEETVVIKRNEDLYDNDFNPLLDTSKSINLGDIIHTSTLDWP